MTPDDFGVEKDIPAYQPAGDATQQDIYQRTGKAAPTEVFASSGAQISPGVSQPANETVAIARDATQSAVSQEPATVGAYPQSAAAPDPSLVEPTDTGFEQSASVASAPPARRGTIDLGLLLLRLLLGGFLILDSVKVFFRLGGSEGINGLEDAFRSYPAGDVLAVVLPTLELAAGVFLLLGLLLPVAAMVATAVTGFLAAHAVVQSGQAASVFNWDPSVWLAVMLVGASLVVQFTGPGFYAVDAGRSWARRPLASSWIFAVLGIAAAVLLWWFGAGPESARGA